MNTNTVAFSYKTAQKYLNLHSNAVDRGIPFSLILDDVFDLMTEDRCFFTGVRLTHTTRSIDRIDCSKGYERGNVVACHIRFNQIKGEFENKASNKGIGIKEAIKAFKKLDEVLKQLKEKGENE